MPRYVRPSALRSPGTNPRLNRMNKAAERARARAEQKAKQVLINPRLTRKEVIEHFYRNVLTRGAQYQNVQKYLQKNKLLPRKGQRLNRQQLEKLVREAQTKLKTGELQKSILTSTGIKTGIRAKARTAFFKTLAKQTVTRYAESLKPKPDQFGPSAEEIEKAQRVAEVKKQIQREREALNTRRSALEPATKPENLWEHVPGGETETPKEGAPLVFRGGSGTGAREATAPPGSEAEIPQVFFTENAGEEPPPEPHDEEGKDEEKSDETPDVQDLEIG